MKFRKLGMIIMWATVIIFGLGTIGSLIWAFSEKSEKKATAVVVSVSTFSVFFWTGQGLYKIYRPTRKKNNRNNRNKNHAPNPSIDKIIKL